MGAWSTYLNKVSVHGKTQRDRVLFREKKFIKDNIPDSLSYFTATIEGASQNVAIIDSDNFDEKYIFSIPGETFACGSLVEWMDNHWLVTEKDANTEIRTRGIMIQCNHLLKWIDDDGNIQQEWVVVEDGTKYMVGENENRDFIATKGEFRASIIMQRNEHTAKLKRTNRFLIDDSLTDNVHAFQLTKPLRTGMVYNDEGVFKFIIQETYTTDDDNLDLRIADYYKYYDKDTESSDDLSDIDDSDTTVGKVWL